MHLLPAPQILALHDGAIPKPPPEVYLSPDAAGLEASLPTLGFTASSEDANIQLRLNSLYPRVEYTLVISPSGILIQAASEAAGYHALATLRQILQQHSSRLPVLEIRDWPDLQQRGFMLDISRCRVPTQESLHDLIDLLASLKYNQLQLYTEHTFAYREHEEVWKNASPLTSKEVKEIDAYCRLRYIELVPNQNSFGHMERWLRHPAYHHLAESPGGFEHPLAGWKPHGSTLKPTEASAAFVDSLFAELLLNFASKQFNIGGDEPWELGQGFSKGQVSARGKTRVYLDHLLRIQEKVHAHGRTMQFWGDIIINEPELAKELGKNVTALLWGYEADHPFPEQCQAMQRNATPFLVVPGTSAWNSIGGRLQTAETNIKAAAANAKRYAAKGLLLTEWGDNGHHQSSLPRLIPILLAAGLSWSNGEDPSLLAKAATELIPKPVSKNQYADLETLGSVPSLFSKHLHNQSWLNRTLFAKGTDFPQLASDLVASEVAAAREQLETVRSDGHLGLARDLLLFSTRKAQHLLQGTQPEALPAELVERFRALWTQDSCEGGLQEAIDHLQGP